MNKEKVQIRRNEKNENSKGRKKINQSVGQ
jgi:hypothetical protein